MKKQIAFAAAFAASMTAVAIAQTPTSPRSATGSADIVTVTGCVTSGEVTGSTGGSLGSTPSFVLSNPTMGSAGSSGAPGTMGAPDPTSPPSTSPMTTPPSSTPPPTTAPPSSTVPPTTAPPSTVPPTTAPPSTTTPPTTTSPTTAGSPQSSQPGMTTPGTAGTTGANAAAGYRLSGGQPDTLKGLQNQRVEIRGTFQNDPAGSSTSSASPMRTLRITSIRPVPGDCGANR
jgi:hypothetical protein